jgi:hypothetical protein
MAREMTFVELWIGRVRQAGKAARVVCRPDLSANAQSVHDQATAARRPPQLAAPAVHVGASQSVALASTSLAPDSMTSTSSEYHRL